MAGCSYWLSNFIYMYMYIQGMKLHYHMHCIIIIIIIINDIIEVHKYYWSIKCTNKNHNVNTIATFHTTIPRK